MLLVVAERQRARQLSGRNSPAVMLQDRAPARVACPLFSEYGIHKKVKARLCLDFQGKVLKSVKVFPLCSAASLTQSLPEKEGRARSPEMPVAVRISFNSRLESNKHEDKIPGVPQAARIIRAAHLLTVRFKGFGLKHVKSGCFEASGEALIYSRRMSSSSSL